VTSRRPDGVIAIVEITVGMTDVAAVLVSMTPMPPVLMATVSPPQQIWCGPTFAVVGDG